MVIIGILAAVSIPRFADIVRQSEVAAEQGILINLVAALDTYSQEQFIENGVMSWPENPFESLNKVPTVLLASGGKEKVKVMYGALKKKCVNVLVTDEETGLALLRLAKKSKN